MAQVILWWVFWHLLTGLGITIGYHRLLVHRSFQCPKWLEYIWASIGAATLMGPPVRWVAVHRFHHAHSDRPLDPHSPAEKGWWWSQMGWIFHKEEEVAKSDPSQPAEQREWLNRFGDNTPFLKRWAPDIVDDSYYKLLSNRLDLTLYISTLVVSFIIAGWAGLAGRILATASVLWCTWMVNSVGHTPSVGYRNFETRDASRNVWWVALLTSGEGWHNNHHYRPQSARHGIRWWEIDLSWMVIWFMRTVGLAKKVHTFEHSRVEG